MEKTLVPENKLKVTRFNVLDYLKTDEDMAGYLEACLEEGGPEFFFMGLRDVLKAKGVKAVSEKTGLSRESLYKTCAPGRKPQFDTIWKITKALGIPIVFSRPANKAGAPQRRRKRAPAPKRIPAMA